ncbi:hypothetical protein GOBAR_DD28099 [Gossypium barbadense]|nr:hypothetical protein GOBAR_DD28099 [Gossypium barbadense]
MSAKWRAIQHRHRYTYNAVVFPPSFIDSLNQSSLSASAPTFHKELQHLISLNSTYSQVNHVRKLASSFNELLVKEGEKNEALVSTAASFYLEVFFLENSMPLHKTLLSVLAKTKHVFQPVIAECFRLLCNEYRTMSDKKKRFSLSRVALSVMGMPKLGFLVDVIQECAVLVCWDAVLGLKSVVLETELRSNLNTYALPVLLEVDVDGIFPLLACISIGPTEAENDLLYPDHDCKNMELRVEQKVAVLVSLLKVSRSLALIEGDICDDSMTSNMDDTVEAKSCNPFALVCIKGIKVRILVGWLVLALTHIDESLRVDAAEFLFLSPKTSSLPSRLELSLMREAVPLNMRSSSTGFQMKWSSLFRKFFSRVRTALERQFKQGSWQPRMNNEISELCLCQGNEDNTVSRAEELFNFMRWLSCFLFFSCYPSAPYKRKIMAMELIQIMINVWPVLPSSQESSASMSPESCLYPYSVGITSPESTFLLVGSIIDSWDRLRESSFRILLHFPTPLPGISSDEMVQKVITWAKKLVCSPRVRESDAGALTLRLIFRKYVVDLGWRVRVSVSVVCSHSQNSPLNGDYHKCPAIHPVMEYVKSLIHWLDVAVEEGEKDLAEACKNSFVHGVLLALRYTFEELDWNSDAVLCSISDVRHALEKLLELVVRITSMALWVVSADAWYLPEDIDDMVDADAFLLDGPDEMDAALPSIEQEAKCTKSIRDARPSDQVVMVGCWLAMKELSLLLGTIIRKIPLPSYSWSGSIESGHPSYDSIDASVTAISEGMLDLKQLEKIGNHFLEVLLKMKHNGAIDKTRAGFTALCNRLLCSNDPMLCKLTESWMGQLMDRTVAKGQTVDDLLRRSAGIPAAFTALFLAEPEGAPKKLLLRALRWLIDVAKGSLLSPSETNCTNVSCQVSSTKSGLETDSTLVTETIATEKTSKIRDEGVVPTVHAFNVLRAAFNDTNLASDTSGFAAEALIVSIRSFSSPYWEIRNSACLAYTSLVRRMIGFLNVHKRESARRALTGLEFFHRYPSLHPFVFNELKIATELLGDALLGQTESNLAKAVHPSLCPMLILLSRLKPSPIASETGDDLDPFLFMPFIMKCSTQSNLRVRILASRALTGLVSNEKLPTVLLNIASELPQAENQITASPVASIPLYPASGAHHVSYNLIHGLLLQLGSLVHVNCRNLADFSRKDQILGDLMKVLAMCSWFASPKRCPCPLLNCTFLQVLDHMLSVAKSCHLSKNLFAIRNLLLELSTECLDVEASYGFQYYDPTIAELRQQAASSYFSCLFQPSDEVGSLVHVNCRNLADFSRKDQILGDLMKVLAMCSWFASPKRCPCPLLNCTFLQVLDHMLSVAKSCHLSKNLFAIRNLLLELSTECLDVEASYGFQYYDPTIAELRQQAASSYFSCLFQPSDEVGEEVFQIPKRSPLNSMLFQTHEVENSGFLERLIRSFSDSSYEVRLVTLKWLHKFLKSRPGNEINYLSSSDTRIIQNWTKANLQPTLMKLLELEKNHRCMYRILRIIFTWNLLKFQESEEKSDGTLYVGALDYDSVLQLWDRLISLLKLTRHAKTQEILICCLAICVRQFIRLFSCFILTDKGQKTAGYNESGQMERSACFYECITFYVNLIKERSSSSEPVNMRKAAAESMFASGLLEQAEVIASSVINQQISSKNSFSCFEHQDAVSTYAHQILEMWFTCIKLLEDEDDGIRQRAATDIQKFLPPKSSGTTSDTCGARTQVEKVIELSFDRLSSIFGHWIVYFDCLLRWVLDAGNYVISKGDLVRRVFDKEIDNHHEEKLLISQICCSHLEKLPITKSWAGKLFDNEEVRNYLLDWRSRFFQQLVSFAKDHIGKLGVDWIGGVGNHKDAFLPLYANLLGFYAVSNFIFNLETIDGMHLLSDVSELGKAINPFLWNPLISSLYSLIDRLHENKFGATNNCINTRFGDGKVGFGAAYSLLDLNKRILTQKHGTNKWAMASTNVGLNYVSISMEARYKNF